ncbi:translocation/assembly module TamB domain-containing protein [Cyanobacterium aponinum]|uniref:translocation/assembly module TamB domain-containing protein n=1 Tax=Cyanobacterium aponinum TaxID=379064 RepID=UPI000C12A554|nr:translocation/assembly module TamB domain-containing protein [Cyanobacterium aponinum]PHV62761.1 hypothetical protein CSQ80_08570 [Cyanobacterium aponinum IPPAS B-1201]
MIDSSDYSLSDSKKNKVTAEATQNQKNLWRWFTYLTLLSVGGGLSYGWHFTTEKLNPLLEKSISNYLSRPVELGKINTISFNHLTIGKTIIPSTATENDSAIVEEIIVHFNPLKLLSKKLDLDITLNQGEIYLQQDKNNSWLRLNISNQKSSLPWGLSINVNDIQLNSGNLFVKNNLNPEKYSQLNINLANFIFEENKNLFNVEGNVVAGGNVNLTGWRIPSDNQWVLNINAENILTETFNQLNLVRLPLQINSGKLQSNLTLEFQNETLDSIEGKINVNQVDVSFSQLPYPLVNSNGDINLSTDGEIKLDNITTNLGLIPTQVTGIIDKNRNLNINANITNSLTVDDVASSLKLTPFNLETEGKIKGNVSLTGNVYNPIVKVRIANADEEIKVAKIPLDKITANLAIVDSQLNIEDVTILPKIGGEIKGSGFINLQKANSKFSIDWQGKEIDGEKLLNLYQKTLPISLGKISGNYNFSGDWREFSNFQLIGASNITLPQGEARVKNLQLNSDSWLANIEISQGSLRDLSFINCEKLKCQDSILRGNFNLSGNTQNLNQENLKLEGDFSFNLGENQIVLENTYLKDNNWQTTLEVNNFPLTQLLSLSNNPENQFLNVPGIDKGNITAGLIVKGDLDNQENINIEGQGDIFLPQGKIKVNQIKVAENNFVANTFTEGFSLSQLNNSWDGQVKGDLTVKGNVNSITPDKISVDGNLSFAQGISLISQPVTVSFGWNGEYLQVNQAVSDNFQARGIINLDAKTQTIKDFDLDVTTQQMSLSKLSLPASLSLLNYQGNVDFQGKLIGNLSQPQLKGDVTLNKFEVASLNFSPLRGELSFSPQQGLDLTLNDSNSEDKLAVILDSQLKPQEIYLQKDTTQLRGLRESENFVVDMSEIPLGKVTKSWKNYLPTEIKEVGGILSGEVSFNLNDYSVSASKITITKPRLNHFHGDILTSEVIIKNDVIEFLNGNLHHQENEYKFTGKLVSLTNSPQLRLGIEIEDGDIQNLLTSWEFFEFADISKGFQPREYASAKDLYSANSNSNNRYSAKNDTISVVSDKSASPSSESNLSANPPLFAINSEEDSLLETIDTLKKVENNLKLKREKILDKNLPSLEELTGKFNGVINLGFSSQDGVKADFDFRGDSWQWGDYEGNFLQVTGSYHNNLLTFLPVIIKSDETTLSLTGTFQPERISGEVTLSNFPLSQIADIANLPDTLNIQGNVNSAIAISGSEKNPLAKGNIEAIDVQINNKNIDQTNASFGLRNSRIDFLASSNLTNNNESLKLIGSLPFQIFPNSSKPNNNDFKLDINLNKDGFTLLDIVTNNQLKWLEGDGNIDLNIKGKYNQEKNSIKEVNTEGIITLNNGVVQGKAIDNQTISNINGQVLFDFSQLNIPNLVGEFSGGSISLNGSLPLIDPQLNNQLLSLNVSDLSLNIDELYRGNASAELNISGSFIRPNLGGEINLYDGQIELSKNQSENIITEQGLINNINISDLYINLQDNIIIEQPPILNLRAKGQLNLKGKLNNLSPQGIIKLTDGNINLFTSQLSLANNYNNTAKFTPENGFNPYLDLQLESSVTETSRYQFADTSNSNEIRDLTNFSIDTVQTIKIKAGIKGWSDNLENNIVLSSSPQRNEAEIIALLGGGFFNNLTEANGNLDLVNLASAAFLGGVQGEIQKAFGFDELRLFPTQILNPENRISTLGLGAELALDLTDDLSISIMKILTNEQSPRYSIRYRLNEQTIFRGSSDFEQDTRGVLEFEHRF